MGSEGPAVVAPVPRHGQRPASRGHPGPLRSDQGRARRSSRTFGGAEVFALKMTTSWVGTSAKNDIPVPKGRPPGTTCPARRTAAALGRPPKIRRKKRRRVPRQQLGKQVRCWRIPLPATGLVNRMRGRLARLGDARRGSARRASGPRWRRRPLVEPTKAAMGFPSGVPGIPDSIFLPENFIFPVFDYDWGPRNSTTATRRGTRRTRLPRSCTSSR